MKTMARWSHATAGLVVCCSVAAQDAPKQVKKAEPVLELATLGASTRAPTKDDVETLDLKFEVRARGQIVIELVEDGAAVKSGLIVGDVIVSLGGVEVFSQDDIADILRVSAPGQKIKASILRAKTGEEEALEISLGAKEVKAPEVAPLAWTHASLANLDAAIAKAKKDEKLVLVGLSGAET